MNIFVQYITSMYMPECVESGSKHHNTFTQWLTVHSKISRLDFEPLGIRRPVVHLHLLFFRPKCIEKAVPVIYAKVFKNKIAD